MSLSSLFGRLLSSISPVTSSLQITTIRYASSKASLMIKPTRLKAGYENHKYTTKPLPLEKTGGRGPDGQIWTHHIGGGHKQRYRMVDLNRGVPEGNMKEERVYNIIYDPLRTARLALVACGEHKRYIIATDRMKAGDIIRSHSEIPPVPVLAVNGDSHPVGALPIGTMIHSIERFEGKGGKIARAAGTSGLIMAQYDGYTVIRMPSGREMKVSNKVIAVVGRTSNVEHENFTYGSPNRKRWFGIRPRSGLWHRKTGYHGRKIKKPKAMANYYKPNVESDTTYSQS